MKHEKKQNVRSREYEVGYRRPPKSGQFKPGQSGNLRGRPKVRPSIDAMLRQELFKPVTVHKDGVVQKVTTVQALIAVLLASALGGKVQSVSALVKLLERFGFFEIEAKRAKEAYPLPNIEVTFVRPKENRPGQVIRTDDQGRIIKTS